MPRLPPLPPQFRAIRDSDMTEDDKLKAVIQELVASSPGALQPPEDELPLPSSMGDGTLGVARRGRDGKIRIVAMEPEVSRSLLKRAFLHPDEED